MMIDFSLQKSKTYFFFYVQTTKPKFLNNFECTNSADQSKNSFIFYLGNMVDIYLEKHFLFSKLN